MARTRVVWKWEDEDESGEGVGPVWVDTLEGDSTHPTSSEKWDRWVTRSEAASFARKNGYEFLADD
jgi:hypothetical protein